MNNFIVMQGRTYNEEKEACIIWSCQIDQAKTPSPLPFKTYFGTTDGSPFFQRINNSFWEGTVIFSNCKITNIFSYFIYLKDNPFSFKEDFSLGKEAGPIP